MAERLGDKGELEKKECFTVLFYLAIQRIKVYVVEMILKNC